MDVSWRKIFFKDKQQTWFNLDSTFKASKSAMR